MITLLGHALLFPVFEPPDEFEHLQYANAFAEQGWIHPLTDQNLRQWGIETFQPPLYYALAGGLLNLAHAEGVPRVAVNREANPWYPHIRHDQRFDHLRGLRLLRFVSVGIGLLWAWGAWRLMGLLGGGNGRVLVWTIWVFAPHSVQIFSAVNNDGLCLTALVWSFYFAWQTTRQRRLADAIGWGLCWGLALAVKVTAVLFAPLWLALLLTRWGKPDRAGLRALLAASGSFLMVALPALWMHSRAVGDFTGSQLLKRLTPGFYRDVAPWDLVWPILDDWRASLLIDWGHHAISWPMISTLWALAWGLVLVLSAKGAWEHRHHQHLQRTLGWLALVGVATAFLFQLRIASEMANIQVRHLWSLLLVSWLPLITWAERYATKLLWMVMGLYLATFSWGWWQVSQRWVGPKSVRAQDVDYTTFRDLYVADRAEGYSYLRTGSTSLGEARRAYSQGQLRRAKHLALEFLGIEENRQARFLATACSFELGELDEAYVLGSGIAEDEPAMMALWFEILMARDDPDQAARFLEGWREKGSADDKLKADQLARELKQQH